jgi:hypothetical protein
MTDLFDVRAMLMRRLRQLVDDFDGLGVRPPVSLESAVFMDLDQLEDAVESTRARLAVVVHQLRGLT